MAANNAEALIKIRTDVEGLERLAEFAELVAASKSDPNARVQTEYIYKQRGIEQVITGQTKVIKGHQEAVEAIVEETQAIKKQDQAIKQVTLSAEMLAKAEARLAALRKASRQYNIYRNLERSAGIVGGGRGTEAELTASSNIEAFLQRVRSGKVKIPAAISRRLGNEQYQRAVFGGKFYSQFQDLPRFFNRLARQPSLGPDEQFLVSEFARVSKDIVGRNYLAGPTYRKTTGLQVFGGIPNAAVEEVVRRQKAAQDAIVKHYPTSFTTASRAPYQGGSPTIPEELLAPLPVSSPEELKKLLRKRQRQARRKRLLGDEGGFLDLNIISSYFSRVFGGKLGNIPTYGPAAEEVYGPASQLLKTYRNQYGTFSKYGPAAMPQGGIFTPAMAQQVAGIRAAHAAVPEAPAQSGFWATLQQQYAAGKVPPEPPKDGGGGGGGGSGYRGRSFLRTFRSLSIYASAATVIYGIGAAIRDATSAGVEFESTMRRVEAILPNQSITQKLTLEHGVVDAARRYGVDLLEAANSVKVFAQQGLSTTEIIKELNATLAASQGLGIDPEEARETLIAVRNITAVETDYLSAKDKKLQDFTQHQVESMEFLDRVSRISSRNAVSPQVLMNSVTQAAPVAAQFKGNVGGLVDPIDLVMGLTTVMNRQTRVTGQSAGTSLRFILDRLGQPKVLEQLGQFGAKLGVEGSHGTELRPLQEILQELADTYKRLGPDSAEGKRFLNVVAGNRQMPAAILMLTQYTKALEVARTGSLAFGDTESRVGSQMDTIKTRLTQLNTELRAFGVSLVEGPLGSAFGLMLDKINEGLREMHNGLSQIDSLKMAAIAKMMTGNPDGFLEYAQALKQQLHPTLTGLDAVKFRPQDMPRLAKFRADAIAMGTTPEALIAATGTFAEGINHPSRNIGGEKFPLPALNPLSPASVLIKQMGGDRNIIAQRMLEQFKVTPGGREFVTWLDSITVGMKKEEAQAKRVQAVMALLGDTAYLTNAGNLPHHQAIGDFEQEMAKLARGEIATSGLGTAVYARIKNPLADLLTEFQKAETSIDAQAAAAQRLGVAFNPLEEHYSTLNNLIIKLTTLKPEMTATTLQDISELRNLQIQEAQYQSDLLKHQQSPQASLGLDSGNVLAGVADAAAQSEERNRTILLLQKKVRAQTELVSRTFGSGPMADKKIRDMFAGPGSPAPDIVNNLVAFFHKFEDSKSADALQAFIDALIKASTSMNEVRFGLFQRQTAYDMQKDLAINQASIGQQRSSASLGYSTFMSTLGITRPSLALPYQLAQSRGESEAEIAKITAETSAQIVRTQQSSISQGGKLGDDDIRKQIAGITAREQTKIAIAQQNEELKEYTSILKTMEEEAANFDKLVTTNTNARLAGLKEALSSYESFGKGKALQNILGTAGKAYVSRQLDSLFENVFGDHGVLEGIGKTLGMTGESKPILEAHIQGGQIVAQSIINAFATVTGGTSTGATGVTGGGGLNITRGADGKLAITNMGEFAAGVTNSVDIEKKFKSDQTKQILNSLGSTAGNLLGSYAGRYTSPTRRSGPNAEAVASFGALAGNLIPIPGLGPLIGGVAGGLLGGFLDKTPAGEALQIIARNSGTQVTLLEQTNKLLDPTSVSFNVPTSFRLPAYLPTLAGGGGGGTVVNNINVSANVNSTEASVIGKAVASAVAQELNNQYTRTGRYVPRVGV